LIYFLKKIIKNQKQIKQIILISQITQYIIFFQFRKVLAKKKNQLQYQCCQSAKCQILQIELFIALGEFFIFFALAFSIADKI
jgi:hypothetical protein